MFDRIDPNGLGVVIAPFALRISGQEAVLDAEHLQCRELVPVIGAFKENGGVEISDGPADLDAVEVGQVRQGAMAAQGAGHLLACAPGTSGQERRGSGKGWSACRNRNEK